MTYSEPMETYVSARGRATAITILTSMQLVVLAVAAVSLMSGLCLLARDPSTAGVALIVGGSLEAFDGLLFLATFIVFMTWVYRSIANLPALGSMSCRFTPAGAVWSWFIPFVNLVRGHQVMATIWSESQPPAVNENGFYLPRKSTIVHWWWGMYLFTTVVAIVTQNSHPVGTEELRSLVSTQAVMMVLRMAEATLFLIMVRGAQKRQDEMWQDLVLRQNVPQPTAEALR
ncbi:MAG: zinc-ribbon protein [bacterium]|nr:zinc-ribbon protein [bacterium]